MASSPTHTSYRLGSGVYFKTLYGEVMKASALFLIEGKVSPSIRLILGHSVELSTLTCRSILLDSLAAPLWLKILTIWLC